MLTTDQVQAWERDGFLVVPDAIDHDACDALMALAQNLANSAETLAAAESNPFRQAELRESAVILHHVRPTLHVTLKRHAKRSICSSWHFSWITAATR